MISKLKEDAKNIDDLTKMIHNTNDHFAKELRTLKR